MKGGRACMVQGFCCLLMWNNFRNHCAEKKTQNIFVLIFGLYLLYFQCFFFFFEQPDEKKTISQIFSGRIMSFIIDRSGALNAALVRLFVFLIRKVCPKHN